ncbi:MAG: helix-turn-helix domain-containing protein [Victivallaceae bacterium]
MTEPIPGQACGAHYFTSGIAIAVSEVNPSPHSQHPYDLTGVEHCHDFSELVLITAGSTVHHLDGEAFPVSAGDLFLIQGKVRHHFAERAKVGMLNVQFDPEQLALPFASLRQMPGYHVIFHLEPARPNRAGADRLRLEKEKLIHAEELIRRLQRELHDRAPGFEAAALALLVELIVFVARSYAERPGGSRAALLRIGEVISRIERDYARPLTLKDLAATVHVSPNHLLRLFKAATGVTPGDYLFGIRLDRAARQLRESDRAISEIAAAVGFADSNYFTRRFRARFGQSPREYRRRVAATQTQ